MSELFTRVKAAVTARQAAERYGLKVNPSGKLTMTFPIDALDHPSSANFPAFPQRGESEEGLRKTIEYFRGII